MVSVSSVNFKMSSILSTGESPGKMYALATVLTVLAIAAVVLRVHARRMIKSGLAWDDFLVVIALVRLYLLATSNDGNSNSETDR